MDFAYDHINEEILAGDDKAKQGDKSADKQGNNEKGDKAEQTAAGPSSTDTTSSNSESGNIDLSTEVQERFRALSENDWSQTLGDLWGNFRRQGETYYNEARQEVDVASEEAKKNLAEWTDTIVRNTRGLSLGAGASSETDTNKSKVNENKPDKDTPEAAEREVAEKAGEGETTGKEEGFISKFRAEATKRLKEIERAEDAADEALSRFGSSVASFFKEAVSITGPDNEHKEGDPLLFASKDVEGRRIIHTTRFEAELHSIHANLDCFTDDPQSAEWPEWAKDFDVAKRTEDISSDLESYPELRKAMESLVPEKVQYADFWRRYYFLRHVIESEETKRKEMLKGWFWTRRQYCSCPKILTV